MKIDALNHPKTIQLSVHLNVCLPQAIGHLELLWAFVAQKTPRGNIGRWSDAVIAHAAHWTEDPAVFVKALIDSGFCDEHDEHRVIIHDWHEHCPNWVRAKLKKEGRAFISTDLSTDLRGDITGHYKPSQAKGSKHMYDSDESHVRFEEIWQARPKRPNESKQRTLKAYRARIREGVSHEDLLAAVQRYAVYCEAEETKPKFIKHLSTFLGAEGHWQLPWDIPAKPIDLPRDNQSLWAIRSALKLPFEYDDLKSCHAEIQNHLLKHPEQRSIVEAMT